MPSTAFGHPDCYYANSSSASYLGEKAAQQVIENVLTSTDGEARDKVARVVKQWNLIIRDYLVGETALRLTVGSDQQSVPIRVKDGLPLPFAALVKQHPNPLLWKLYLHRSAIEQMTPVLLTIANNFSDIRALDTSLATLNADDADIQRVSALIQAINGFLGRHALLKDIRQINQDVLGAYFFQIPEVHLYWMVIGVVAGIAHVPVEALTVVVLTHELAHAYTHLGRDIDGRRWDTSAFSMAEKNIVEGLAQFYTRVVCETKLGPRYPDAAYAYRRLLNMQSGPYQIHVGWGMRTMTWVNGCAMP